MIKYWLLVFTFLYSNIFSMEPLKKVSKNDLTTTVGEFGFSLFETINTNQKNVVYSPFSVTSSILTLSIGSNKKTKSEIQKILKINLLEKKLQSNYNRLYTNLFITEKPCKFLLTNLIFIDTYNQLLESFEKTVTSTFHAKIEKGSFNQNKNNQVDKINRYFATRSDFDLIDILSTTTPLNNTKLLLINMLFMSGTWKKPFNISESEPASFLNFPQNKTTTYKMKQTAEFLYHENTDFQIASLPIDCKSKDTDINFLIFLPKKEINGSDFLWKNFKQILSKLSYKYLNIQLPKFTLNQTFSLKKPLEKLGMKNAFTKLADFSNINDHLDLYLNDIIHGCVLKIDENGINAKDEDIQVSEYKINQSVNAISYNVNKSFYFMICDLKSKTVLFIGKVLKLDGKL